MNPLHTALSFLCLFHASCGKHASLQNELSDAENSLRTDQAAIKSFDAKIMAVGGSEKLAELQQEVQELRSRVQSLESDNQAQHQKWSAIDAEVSVLKPAADAFKKQHAKTLGTQP